MSTPLGRLGSSLLRGRSAKSVASIARIRSTPAGRAFPYVANHLSPFKRAVTESSSTGPFPGRGKVATTASTCSYLHNQSQKSVERCQPPKESTTHLNRQIYTYHGIIGLPPRVSCKFSSSNSSVKISSISVSKFPEGLVGSPSCSSAHITSGGGAMS